MFSSTLMFLSALMFESIESAMFKPMFSSALMFESMESGLFELIFQVYFCQLIVII